MPSLHPLTKVQQQIKTPHIREAFDRVIGDKASPNQINKAERDAFLRAGTHNDASVRGHDLTAEELADYRMIAREGGAHLFRTQAERAAFERRLATYDAKPKVSISDTDPAIDVRSVALNKVAIQGRANGDLCPSGVVCIIGGPTTVTVEVGGKKFAVRPEPKERASSIAARLAAELEDGGYKTSVRTAGGRTVLTVLSASGVEPERKTYAAGTYAQLEGTISSAPDGAQLLVLKHKIQVGDAVTDRVRVEGRPLPAGADAVLNGRLDLRQLPLEIFPPMFEVSLSGVSNVSAGEPKFDGEVFTNALGKACERLTYHPAGMFDGPSTIFVLDQSNDKAFVGSFGGMADPALRLNPFHGFSGARAIRNPTRQDIFQVQFRLPDDTPGGRAREQWPYSRATGEALVQVSEEIGVAGRRWFMDPSSNRIYGFDVAGPTERVMAHVIAKDPRDV